MQQFGNFAYDFSDKAFPDYSLGARLLDNPFSESEVRKMSSSSEPLEEIKKAFSRELNFEQDPSVRFESFETCCQILEQIPYAYYKSASFQIWETLPPFQLLETYVQKLAKDDTVLPRVDRSELYERECFIVDFSKYLFEAQPNIGAVCVYGSFARGRKNPNDIDVAILLKAVHQAGYTSNDGSYSWDWLKSREVRNYRGLDENRPLPDREQFIIDLDEVYYLVENYQDNSPVFKQVSSNNNYGHNKKVNFKINAIVLPYQFDFSTHYIMGGNIWVINSKENGNYRAFFSLGTNFWGDKSDYSDKIFVP